MQLFLNIGSPRLEFICWNVLAQRKRILSNHSRNLKRAKFNEGPLKEIPRSFCFSNCIFEVIDVCIENDFAINVFREEV
jgi:hypothetical protein